MSRPPLALRSVVPRALGRPGQALGVLWRFSRPHTLIGTSVGIAGLYAIAVSRFGDESVFHLAMTLLAGACVNVYIVGINQIEDVAIDRVNKPWLPIAAGDLSPTAARRIVAVAGVLPLVLGLTQGPVETGAVAIALALGTAYSVPPARLKRFPALASLSITFVRAFVVNLGVWLHFQRALGPGGRHVDPVVWALIAVTLPFSFAIAILKDVPDVEGDRRYGVATFSVRLGGRPVFALGLAALTAAEVGMAGAGLALLDEVSRPLLVGGHLAALALLWIWAARVDLGDHASIAAFYQRVWQLFFLEYLLLPLAAVLG
jgi:homogentisate phytyltransferase / homogentisate geranylgeranyltransferase